ncbi:MAG: sigma-54-dependent Fis family transcriptional regulator [Nitrospirae bacterium]|nr:sigma-54-dependent Fis family transcriptional regulator [Nitrospirota bacterium]
MKKNVLIIEDEPIMRNILKNALTKSGFETIIVEDGIKGISAINEGEFDIIITDIVLPKGDGFKVLKWAKEKRPETSVILITGHGKVKDAVEAMKLGASDYLTKPFSMEDLALRINKIVEFQELKRDYTRLQQECETIFGTERILGVSPKIAAIRDLTKTVAGVDSTILIEGESGTGKEVVANAIHYSSPRREKPFIKISCAAIPETLLESELFGYEKGAFTGALKRKPGRFELANHGTLFLDEIGDLPQALQVKLLRVLQEREFERIGGTETIKVDVRIICATNRDLEKETKEGRFREDLYYRLKVIPIHLPPLRGRKEDIPILINHFIKIYSKKMNKKITAFSDEAMKYLLEYNFPGNIRELENIVERTIALCPNQVMDKEYLPLLKDRREKPEDIRHWRSADNELRRQVSKDLQKKEPDKLISLQDKMTDVERNYIINVLKNAKGNKTKAAEILNISRKNLWEKMKKYNLLDASEDNP